LKCNVVADDRENFSALSLGRGCRVFKKYGKTKSIANGGRGNGNVVCSGSDGAVNRSGVGIISASIVELANMIGVEGIWVV